MKIYNCFVAKLYFIKNRLSSAHFPQSVCAGDLWNRANSLFLMSALHKNVGLAGRSIAQRAICALPLRRFTVSDQSDVDDEFLQDQSSFASLRSLIEQRKEDFTPLDTMMSTASLASKILAYGVFCKAITSGPIPLEEWNFFALLFGPWWSSAFWVEWVCYDFFRSAFAQDPYGGNSTAEIDRWFPFEHQPEINWAYKYDKKSFYFSSMILLGLYASMFYVRPQISRILIKKLGDAWAPFFTEIEAKNTLCFVQARRKEIEEELPQTQLADFHSALSDLQHWENERKDSPSQEYHKKGKACLKTLHLLLRDLPSCHDLYCLPEDRFNV